MCQVWGDAGQVQRAARAQHHQEVTVQVMLPLPNHTQPMEDVRGDGWWLVRDMRSQRQRAQLERGGEGLSGGKAFSARPIVHGQDNGEVLHRSG